MKNRNTEMTNTKNNETRNKLNMTNGERNTTSGKQKKHGNNETRNTTQDQQSLLNGNQRAKQQPKTTSTYKDHFTHTRIYLNSVREAKTPTQPQLQQQQQPQPTQEQEEGQKQQTQKGIELQGYITQHPSAQQNTTKDKTNPNNNPNAKQENTVNVQNNTQGASRSTFCGTAGPPRSFGSRGDQSRRARQGPKKKTKKKRGRRSKKAIEQRKMNRSDKRIMARRNHRKKGLRQNQVRRKEEEEPAKAREPIKLRMKMTLGKTYRIATLNIRSTKKPGVRDEVEK